MRTSISLLDQKKYFAAPDHLNRVQLETLSVFQMLALFFTKGLRDPGVQQTWQEEKEKFCRSVGFGLTRTLGKRNFTITILCQKRLSELKIKRRVVEFKGQFY